MVLSSNYLVSCILCYVNLTLYDTDFPEELVLHRLERAQTVLELLASVRARAWESVLGPCHLS